jgi:amino acid adenylation domain-containing protein
MTQLTRYGRMLSAVDRREACTGIAPRPMPTSPAQRRLWSMLSESGAGQAFDAVEAIELRFDGALDIAALHAALNDLLARHDVLRARFTDDGKLMLVSPTARLDLLIDDLADTTAAMHATRIAAFVEEAVTQPLDPCHDLPLRASLLQIDDEHHRLLLLLHRLVGDRASLTRLATELGSLYALRSGMAAESLPPAASVFDLQPADAGAADPKAAGSTAPITRLPSDRPRGRHPEPSLARSERWLAAGRLVALRALATQQGVELQAVLAAAAALWVARLSGDDTVCFVWRPADDPAVPVPRGEQRLTLQVDLTAPFTGLLDAAAAALQTAGGQAPDDPAAVSVALLPDLDALVDAFPGSRVEVILPARRSDLCEVSLEIALGRADARFDCHYQISLFSAATISHWLDSFDCLLGSLAGTPAAAAGSLALLGEATRTALDGWQPRFRPLPDSGWIHRSVDASRQRHPERPALHCHDGQLDYAGLAARSNRIAHALQAHGVGPGERVGLCLERDLQMLPAILAVLKCGAAYVPLDPGFPPERLDFMVRDADLALVVSNRRLFDTLRLPIDERLLLDQDRDEIDACSDADIDLLPADADPRRTPAYVIYTSGSTGTPKGVVVPHAAVANFLHGMAERPGFTAADRLVAITTLSFDIAVLELLLPLWVGAEVVLATREQVADGRKLRRLIEASGANTLQATPAAWRLLLDAGFQPPAGFRALCGGEALPADLAERLTTNGVELWNLYGPTETAVWSTCWKVEPRTRGIAIGQPIRNTHVRVLDACGQQCPVGVSGEICIGGDGVALGYWQRPELTADRFVPDHFLPAEPGEPPRKLYRTGDRGRWCSDGQLEHQGRFDHQVKLRGYRIELGGIEARITALESVACCLVIVREDRPGDQRLVAYIVPKPGQVPDTARMRAALRRFLPEYMVPQHLVPLAQLPRLPNGKTDLRCVAIASGRRCGGRRRRHRHRPPTAVAAAGLVPRLVG